MSDGTAIVNTVRLEREKAEARDARKTSGLDFSDMVDGLGLAAIVFGAPVLMPAVLIIGAIKVADGLTADDPEAKKRHMSDEWLGQVSDWSDASPEGLAFLSKLLAKQGYVTVHQAGEWLKIEHKIALKKAAEREKAQQVTASGATALLSRAKRDIPSLIDVSEITDALYGLRVSSEEALLKIPGAGRIAGVMGAISMRSKKPGA